MDTYFFKNNQEAVFGIRYSKHLLMDNEHTLTFSFWKWDLIFEW